MMVIQPKRAMGIIELASNAVDDGHPTAMRVIAPDTKTWMSIIAPNYIRCCDELKS